MQIYYAKDKLMIYDETNLFTFLTPITLMLY